MLKSRGKTGPTVSALLLALITIGVLAPAQAHDLRPTYVEISTTEPDHYRIYILKPLTNEKSQLDWFELAPHCKRTGNQMSVLPTGQSLEAIIFVMCEQAIDRPIARFNSLDRSTNEALLRVKKTDGGEEVRLLTSRDANIYAPGQENSNAVRSYLGMGVAHILDGWDHILFIAGIVFLLSTAVKTVFTLTAFTIAHSITFGLATAGVFVPSAAPIEAIIALSLVLLAREILKNDDSSSHFRTWGIAFVFGLFHGFGFASAADDLGMSDGQLGLIILLFNAGIEIGQIIIVVLILALISLTGLIFEQDRKILGKPAAYGIGFIGTFLLIQRIASF